MPATDQSCYVFIQLPGTFERVICESLRVREVGQNSYVGTFQYGRSYRDCTTDALDQFHLPLSARPRMSRSSRASRGALRDANPDAWGRRVIQAKLSLPEADFSEIDHLPNGPGDRAGNLRFRPTTALPNAPRPFSRAYQLQALVEATQTLEEGKRAARDAGAAGARHQHGRRCDGWAELRAQGASAR